MRSRTLYLTALLATIFLVLLVAATLATRGTRASPGTTLYVSTDGVCQGNSPCYTNVQEALDDAATDDEIRVATGTYTDTAYTVAEITETITLQGGWNADFSARNPTLYPTTLDAQGLGRVIQITGSISPTIEGFIITAGRANAEDVGRGRGGGIYSTGAAPIIQHNVITNNLANQDLYQQAWGGGIYLENASALALISGNTIISNAATSPYAASGGGLCIFTSSGVKVIGNEISNNTTYGEIGSAGGIWVWDSESITFSENKIIHNTSSSPYDAEAGGGLRIDRTSPFTLTNNIIAQNNAKFGSGIYVYGSWQPGQLANGSLTNNTIAQNNPDYGWGILLEGWGTLTLTNNIVVTHTYGIYAGDNATIMADYTLFFGNTSGDTWGPITSTHEVSGDDPLFLNPSAWDYHIQVASPAVNKGTFTGAPAVDFEGDARPYDCFIDIGADENTASDYCKRIYLPLILKNY